MTPTLVAMLKAPVAGAVKTRLAATVGDARALAIYRQLVARMLRAAPPDWPLAIHFAPARRAALLRRWLAPLSPRELRAAPPVSAVAPRKPAAAFLIPQVRGHLGTKLAAAFAAEFARGAPAVIAIGGDCPALDCRRLRAAARALAHHDAVLGPATDGGYYLLGLRAPHPELFTGIAWSSPAVLAQTRARLRASCLATHELPPLNDVDDAAAWRRARAAGLLPPPLPVRE